MKDEMGAKAPKELKGKGGRDGSAYKGEMGGMAKGSRNSKLDAQGGVKAKNDSCYKEVNNQKLQAGKA